METSTEIPSTVYCLLKFAIDLPVPQAVKCQLITTSITLHLLFFHHLFLAFENFPVKLQALGAPARAGGVQSFTTLWFEKDAPSESHIAQTARP